MLAAWLLLLQSKQVGALCRLQNRTRANSARREQKRLGAKRYVYTSDQLRAIRQDIVVQRLDGDLLAVGVDARALLFMRRSLARPKDNLLLVVDVYVYNATLALEHVCVRRQDEKQEPNRGVTLRRTTPTSLLSAQHASHRSTRRR